MNKFASNNGSNNINNPLYTGSHTIENQNEIIIEYTSILTSTYCSISFQRKCNSDILDCELSCVNEIRKVKCMNGGTIIHSNIRSKEYIIDCDFCKITIQLDMSKIGQNDVYDIVAALNDEECKSLSIVAEKNNKK